MGAFCERALLDNARAAQAHGRARASQRDGSGRRRSRTRTGRAGACYRLNCEVGRGLVVANRERGVTMPLFYAILPGQQNASNASARLDVAIEPEAGESQVTFRVFVNGGPLPNPQTVVTVNGFAKSGNLFTGVPNLTPALVEANIPLAAAAPASGVLHQRGSGSGGAKILLGVGPSVKEASTRVAVAIGDLMDGTTILNANVNSGADTGVEVIIGNISAGGRRIVNDVPAARIWVLPLEARDANSHVVVRSLGGEPVLVQLAVDDGKVDEATVFPS